MLRACHRPRVPVRQAEAHLVGRRCGDAAQPRDRGEAGEVHLGIAIGIELGITPLARLGLRGEASVRCVSSRSACLSEEVQGRCAAGEIGIGADAYAAADVHVKRMFDNRSRKLRRTGHDAATALLIGAPALTGSAAPAAAIAPLRAYAP